MFLEDVRSASIEGVDQGVGGFPGGGLGPGQRGAFVQELLPGLGSGGADSGKVCQHLVLCDHGAQSGFLFGSGFSGQAELFFSDQELLLLVQLAGPGVGFGLEKSGGVDLGLDLGFQFDGLG